MHYGVIKKKEKCYFVKNCYCLWSFALVGCPFEEASEHNSLLLNISEFSLLIYLVLCFSM